MGSPSASDKYRVRAVKPEDKDFLLETWVGSFRKSIWAGVIPNNRFAEVTEDAIRQLLIRGARVHVAYHEDTPEIPAGYVVHEVTRSGEPVVHYLFVRDLCRKQGVSKKLLDAAGVDRSQKFFYTFRTPQSSYYPTARWAPSIARRKDA